jgi:hypothetical protein
MDDRFRTLLCQAAVSVGYKIEAINNCTIKFGESEILASDLEAAFSDLLENCIMHGINERLAKKAVEINEVFEEAYVKAAAIAGLSLISLD